MGKPFREKIFSPFGILISYISLSFIVITGFGMIFPAESPPLEYFSLRWRFLCGIESFINLFGALSLSVIVIPYGIQFNPLDKFTSFSPKFLKNLSPSIFCAIITAGVYAILLFLVAPVVIKSKMNLEAQGNLYRLSVERARYHADRGEWQETARFLGICDNLWPEGYTIAGLRTETGLRVEEIIKSGIYSRIGSPARQNDLTPRKDLIFPTPLTAAEAFSLAEAAMQEGRYFDAHWLATLGGDLAEKDSYEADVAAALASRAWSIVTSTEPTARETEAYKTYHLKRDAYRAFISSNWIEAYYLFRELLSIVPTDSDGLHYIELCEQGLLRMAFFMDEMELRKSPAGALFSLPFGSGRMIMRFSSLSLFPDVAYGIGLEILALNFEGRLLWRLNAPYVKIQPVSVDTPQISLLMRALDRYDRNLRWEPETISVADTAPSRSQLSISIDWEDFLLLSEIRGGKGNLGPSQLLEIAGLGMNYGYMPQIFYADILGRFAEPVLFLPLQIFFLTIGWRFRNITRKTYIWIPMLGILPLVLNVVFRLFKTGLDNLSLLAVMGLGFSAAVFAFATGALILFLLSLIILASQHN